MDKVYNIEKFLSAQKGEIDAVLMYREFADATKDKAIKEMMLKAAADEGKHANILKKYTNQTITPNKAQAKFLGCLFRVLPKKLMYRLIAKGEISGGDGYKPYIDDYPEFKEMMNDEYHHAEIFNNLAK